MLAGNVGETQNDIASFTTPDENPLLLERNVFSAAGWNEVAEVCHDRGVESLGAKWRGNSKSLPGYYLLMELLTGLLVGSSLSKQRNTC
jgi:hypothetical protein